MLETEKRNESNKQEAGLVHRVCFILDVFFFFFPSLSSSEDKEQKKSQWTEKLLPDRLDIFFFFFFVGHREKEIRPRLDSQN